jgi:hypothetical protein
MVGMSDRCRSDSLARDLGNNERETVVIRVEQQRGEAQDNRENEP